MFSGGEPSPGVSILFRAKWSVLGMKMVNLSLNMKIKITEYSSPKIEFGLTRFITLLAA